MAESRDDARPEFWTIHGCRTLYESPWINLHLYDVELPDGSRIEHHVCEHPCEAVGIVPFLTDDSLVLVDHPRFITGHRGLEIPSGRIEPGESVTQAAARELLEETGYEAGALHVLGAYNPSNGISDQVFHLVEARDLRHRPDAAIDTNEIAGVEVVALDEVVRRIRDGGIRDGYTVTGLFYARHARVSGGGA